MPLTKRSLTRAEMAEHLARAKQLRAAGLDIEIPEEWQENSCVLDIVVAGGCASLVCDSLTGGVHYAVGVRLVARLRVTLVDFRLTTEWDDQIVLHSFVGQTPLCRLGRLEYLRSEVLNQRIENSLRFHYRGQMVEGMILASGLKPIPEAHRTGAIVPFRLTFTDSLGHEIGVEAELFVDRTAKRQKVPVHPSSRLFGPAEIPEVIEVVVSEVPRAAAGPDLDVDLSRNVRERRRG